MEPRRAESEPSTALSAFLDHTQIDDEIDAAFHLTLWNWRRTFYRGLTTGSIILSPLFAFFLYQSIAKVRDATLKEFSAEDSAWATTALTLLAIYFTLANLFGDPPSLNPTEDAEELVKIKEHEEEQGGGCTLSLAKMNKMLAIPSFTHFAADTAIAIAGLSSNNRTFYLGLGIPFTSFSVLNQYIRTKGTIEEHSKRLVASLSSLDTIEASVMKLLKSPLISLEVSFEAFSNIASQGIAAGYIVDQLNKVFDVNQTNPSVMPWIITATFLTAYNTAFTKVLPAYDHYFNPDFTQLEEADFKKAKLSATDWLLNSSIALTRAFCFIWLSCRFGPQNIFKKSLLAAGLGLANFLHPFYTLYHKQKQEIALEQKRQQEHYLQLINPENELEALLLPSSEKLFDKIAAHFETPNLKKAVTVINVSAHIGQVLSFFGFVADVLQTVEANGYHLPFNFKDTFALALLWGIPIAIIEGRDNQEPLIKTVAYQQAKYQIGAPTEALAQKNILTRTLASFFYAKEHYALPRLRKALKNLHGEEGEEDLSQRANRAGSPTFS